MYIISLIICTLTHSGESGVSTDRGGARLLVNPCAPLVWKEGSLTLVPGREQRCSRFCKEFPDPTSGGYLYEMHSLGIILKCLNSSDLYIFLNRNTEKNLVPLSSEILLLLIRFIQPVPIGSGIE